MVFPFLVGHFIAKRKRDGMLIIESLDSLDRRRRSQVATQGFEASGKVTVEGILRFDAWLNRTYDGGDSRRSHISAIFVPAIFVLIFRIFLVVATVIVNVFFIVIVFVIDRLS